MLLGGQSQWNEAGFWHPGKLSAYATDVRFWLDASTDAMASTGNVTPRKGNTMVRTVRGTPTQKIAEAGTRKKPGFWFRGGDYFKASGKASFQSVFAVLTYDGGNADPAFAYDGNWIGSYAGVVTQETASTSQNPFWVTDASTGAKWQRHLTAWGCLNGDLSHATLQSYADVTPVDGVYGAGHATDVAEGTGGNWVIGNDRDFGRGWLGTIHELIIWRQDIATVAGLRDKMEGYLAWKWGYQDKLPAGHPYKNLAPIN